MTNMAPNSSEIWFMYADDASKIRYSQQKLQKKQRSILTNTTASVAKNVSIDWMLYHSKHPQIMATPWID